MRRLVGVVCCLAITLGCDPEVNGTDAPEPADTDQDGYQEICNGVDDNGNGVIDEEAVDAPVWYFDADGDGYGTAIVTVSDCIPPTGYVPSNDDCDDEDQTVYPGRGC